MTIDNFLLIAEILYSKPITDGEFYFLQILKRRKENPEMTAHVQLIDNWFIKNVDDLMNHKNRIVDECEFNNARAYIRLNKRSQKKIALQTLRLVAENIASEQYDIKNCYLSCCGQFHDDEDKTWVIDFDYTDEWKKGSEIELLSIVQELVRETGRDPKCYLVPTKNGLHIISRPFNMKKFSETAFGKISIHKDNPTILYTP